MLPFQNKKDYKFMFIKVRVQNNNIKNYIKNLDLLYEKIYQQKDQLQQLQHLFFEFNEFLDLNKKQQSIKISDYETQQTSEFLKENDFVYKMVKEISNILDITLNSINSDCLIGNSNNVLQIANVELINQEVSVGLVLSEQKVAFTNNI
ncbi:MAG: hypothetical protein H9Q65_04715 [Spiroplasma ixodetis]|nr:hypothetical protein [Spiroplasma ixodetis]MBP1528525.1 hypothetical protein [Spiroplasma ixodetis]